MGKKKIVCLVRWLGTAALSTTVLCWIVADACYRNISTMVWGAQFEVVRGRGEGLHFVVLV